MKSVLGFTRKPDITVRQSGSIDLSSNLVRTAGIEMGDALDIVQSKGECMLYVKKKKSDIIGSYEATARKVANKKTSHYRVYSIRLARFLFSETGSDANVIRLAMGTAVDMDGFGKCVPIITRRLL